MRRGSFRLRLPRGRRGIKSSPALLSITIFLVLLVPTVFYLFPGVPDSQPSPELPLNIEYDVAAGTDRQSVNISEPVLEAKAIDSALFATVKYLQGLSQVYLENTGSSELNHVEVRADGKTMGILSQLIPGEKKVLAVNGHLEGLKVMALDTSGQVIEGHIQYSQPIVPVASSDPSSEIVVLSTKNAPSNPNISSGSSDISVEKTSPIDSSVSPQRNSSSLYLTINTNKTEGPKGDVVGYRCKAVNVGPGELSDVRINCAGKLASTKFLSSKKELYLDGVLIINNNTALLAGVEGTDSKGKIYTNNTSIYIQEVSPEIDLKVDAPSLVHRGDNITFLIRIENNGRHKLTDIEVRDSYGRIDRIGELAPGAFHILQINKVVLESLHNQIRVFAHTANDEELYASRNQDIQVLNSSLEVTSQPREVRIYPGEPAEVTWILKNTGEETLKNLTLDGNGKKCMLRELSPGESIRMAAVYRKNDTSWINVTARGISSGGYSAFANASVLIKSVRPGIGLKVMPSELDVCPGETAEISCLVSNSGDDHLTDVLLTQDGSALATIGQMEPGEFKVANSRTVITTNSTLNFVVTGKDSRGQISSESAYIKARTAVSAIRVSTSASPSSVTQGENAKITCTVSNTGSVPLYSIFVISREFGPLGNIDYLAPKRQMIIVAEKSLDKAVNDQITVEGFTQDKKSVRGWCGLNISYLSLPGQSINASLSKNADSFQPSSTKMEAVNIGCSNISLPIVLPAEKETVTKVSTMVADDVDRSTKGSKNIILDGISNLLRYVEKMIGKVDQNSESTAAQEFYTGKDKVSASDNYELSIAGVKGSEHGAIRILDVSALPSQPAAGEPVKITVHMQSVEDIYSASAKYGLSDLPLTKQDMLGVDRVYDSPLQLESGNSKDGYWSCTIPGKASGVYMVLSIWITDGSNTAEGGPYMIHWSTVSAKPEVSQTIVSSSNKNGMLFIESSSVKGKGEVSIKDTFQGSAMHFNEKMIGNGSISLETLRCIDRKTAVENFTEKKDLVFTGGNLKGRQTVESPVFHGGMGASVTERFNLSHVDKSETSSVSSSNLANNTLSFKTDQAFDGTWNIQTKYAKFSKKIKADQQYTGSFQTQKDIKFQDAGQK